MNRSFAFGMMTMGVMTACSQQQLAQVQDASNKRDVICQFVSVWSKDRPELEKLDKLCKAGADLKEIARAYGECDEGPLESRK